MNIVSETSDWLTGIDIGVCAILLLTSMTLVAVAALSFQCTATWRWLMQKACSKTYSTEDDCSNKQQATIQISNSLPDLPEQVKPNYVQEIKDVVAKKVCNFAYSLRNNFFISLIEGCGWLLMRYFKNSLYKL